MQKRKICHAAKYIHPEFMDRAALRSSSSPTSARSSLLEDVQMAEFTGVMSQIGHLAAYSMELLDGLFRISLETMDRIESVTERTHALHASLNDLETKSGEAAADGSQLVDLSQPCSVHHKKEVKVPHIFTRM